jgi:hypothetical protein
VSGEERGGLLDVIVEEHECVKDFGFLEPCRDQLVQLFQIAARIIRVKT